MELERPPLASIAVLSGSALAYEVLLIRVFSIIQWHHFAYMVISLALLGYGASGTFLALIRKQWVDRFATFFIANIVAFGISSIFCYMAAERIVINPEEMLWNWRQLLRLPVVYLLLGLPFFFAANAIGLALGNPQAQTTRIYAADLMGAAAGCLGILGLLYRIHPSTAMQFISIATFISAALAWRAFHLKFNSRLIALLLAAVLIAFLPSGWKKLTVSQYKSLPQLMLIPGSRIVDEQSSPLGLITVVENTQVPLRYAPGLSLNSISEPPAQKAVFTDSGAMTVITRFTGNLKDLAYFDQMTSALPYHLRTARKVLVLCAGGGSDVLQARYHGARQIDAVEINRQIADLVRVRYAEFAGAIYGHPGTRLHVADARGFARTSRDTFDLIQIAVPGSFDASSAGLYSLNEDYLFTVEAMQEYLQRLSPDGYLAVTAWEKMPPRDTLKLFATAVEALRISGVKDIRDRLMLIRSWQTSTLLVKDGAVSIQESEGLREFCLARSFDPVYYPRMKREEAGRFNLLENPAFFYDSAVAILGSKGSAFLESYKFSIEPSTDDRPYFFHSFKWRILPEILSRYGRSGISLLETGYLVLIAALVQAFVFSCGLILLPLWIVRKNLPSHPPRRLLCYFLSLGLAFFFIEIAFIQKLQLLLQHPVISAAVTLTAFLLFAGMGSSCSRSLSSRIGSRSTVLAAVAVIAVCGIIYVFALDSAVKAAASTHLVTRILIAIALIAPLGFAMGMPFPQGLAALQDRLQEWIPWAWGINGCASVLSAMLATVLAIEFGFTLVIYTALVLYAAAAVLFPRKHAP